MKKRVSILLAVLMLFSFVLASQSVAFAQGEPGAETYYTVTYLDPSGNFETQEFQVKEGDPVPAFEGTPTRDGWVFTGWNNKYKAGESIDETVTTNRTFSARWQKAPSALDESTAQIQGSVRITDEFKPGTGFDLNSVRLIDGTFEVSATTWNAAEKKWTATVTITDVQPYVEYFTEQIHQYGGNYETYQYAFNAEKTGGNTLTIYLANDLNYAQRADGTWTTKTGGWLRDTDRYVGTSKPTLYLNRAYTVTFQDGVADETIFADTQRLAAETSLGSAPVPEFSVPTRPGYVFDGWTSESGTLSADGKTVTGDAVLVAQWRTAQSVIVNFDSNGGETIAPITKSEGETYGSLPSAGTINGLQNLGWYLVNTDGSVSDTKIDQDTIVAKDGGKLFQKREIKEPSVKIERDRTPYNYTGDPVTLTANVTKSDVLVYTYQWYKDGTLIAGATADQLVLAGNVSDSGTYSVEVTTQLADGTQIQTINEFATTTATDKPLTIRRTNNQLLFDVNYGDETAHENVFDFLKDGKYVARITSTIPERAGYIFDGWNTVADGSGDAYHYGDLYEFIDPSGNGGLRVTLYANWLEDKNNNGIADETETNYTVTYTDGVDGEEIFRDQVTSNLVSGSPTPAFEGTPVRDGYQFIGWSPDISNTVTETIVYVAQWEKLPNSDPTPTPSEDIPPVDDPSSDPIESSDSNTNSTPKTGDNTTLAIWIAVILCCVGISCVTIYTKRKARR